MEKKDNRGGWNKKYRTKKQAIKAKYKTDALSAKKTTKMVTFRFHKVYDKDILDRLGAQPNKTEYLKILIRKDMANDRATK
jgi:hypothetical protein